MEKVWFPLISEVVENGQQKISDYSLECPMGLTDVDIQKAEKRLGFELPAELKSLFMEFDGVHEYATTAHDEKIQVGSLIWSLSSIVELHISFTIPMKSKLFCFGSSISGNGFGYLIVNNKPDENQIWQSDHETAFPDEQIVWRASSLREFITTALTKSRWY